MNKWTLSYGEPTYKVRLSEVPLWRVVVEESYNGLLDRLGHPCCWSLKWVPTERLKDWVAVAQFKLLNNRISFCASGNAERTIETFDITEYHARKISPEFVADMVDIFSPDEPVATFTSSTAAATSLTWTSSMPGATMNP